MNTAFVFIKPHADNATTRGFVKASLAAKGMNVLSEGAIDAKEIDSKSLIDQHYYAIASKATILKPHELAVPADKFEAFFGLGWQEALDAGKVFNARDACEKLGCSADDLNDMWALCKKEKRLIKFGGGFYCGKLPTPEGDDIYVFNGFFMTMRSKYVAEGCSIYYFVVEWSEKDLSWEDFRGKVLGPTDPTTAPADSVRGEIFAKWQELGLPACPDVGDNGVHASASPFEALAERCNWLGAKVDEDAYGQALLAAGVSADTIKAWSVDPQVVVPGEEGTSSLFDSVEDTNSTDCLDTLVGINAANKSEKKSCGACGFFSKYQTPIIVGLAAVAVAGVVAVKKGLLTKN